jgi:oxygen-independent coproporphyrinogen-3 oxidase
MTSLRTIWGCDTVHIENVFGLEWKNEFLRGVEKFIGRNHLRREGTRFFLTDEGKLFADGISSDLFLDEVNPV